MKPPLTSGISPRLRITLALVYLLVLLVALTACLSYLTRNLPLSLAVSLVTFPVLLSIAYASHLKIQLLLNMDRDLRYEACDADTFAGVDREALVRRTAELRALGFEVAGDFHHVRSHPQLPRVFVRFLEHRDKRCLAVLFQALPAVGKASPVHLELVSVFGAPVALRAVPPFSAATAPLPAPISAVEAPDGARSQQADQLADLALLTVSDRDAQWIYRALREPRVVALHRSGMATAELVALHDARATALGAHFGEPPWQPPLVAQYMALLPLRRAGTYRRLQRKNALALVYGNMRRGKAEVDYFGEVGAF